MADSMINIENLVNILREGKPILVFDEDNREGETDIFFSAKYVTHSSVRFLRKNGGGMIFLAAENRASTELGLPFAQEIYEEVTKNNKKKKPGKLKVGKPTEDVLTLKKAKVKLVKEDQEVFNKAFEKDVYS